MKIPYHVICRMCDDKISDPRSIFVGDAETRETAERLVRLHVQRFPAHTPEIIAVAP